MGSTADLLRRVENACGAETSAKALREEVLALLRTCVPYDGHVFTLTDPVTRIASSPHADLRMLPWERLPELIRWRYLSTVNRADLRLGRPATSLLEATDSPSQSPVWQHVLRDIGVVDTAVVALGDRYGAWGFLELWRTTRPFALDELDVLTSLAPTLTHGLRRTVAHTFTESDHAAVGPGPAVVLLGSDLVVRGQTDDAAAALLRLLPPDEPMAPIPAAAYNVGAALLAQEAGIPVGEPWSRVHLGGGRWVTVRASRLGPDIAASIEPSTTDERMDLLSRASGLSARETEILGLVGVGLDSREIAGQLFLSEHTVNDHVKAVLAKTGVRNRQQLLARISGQGPIGAPP